MTMSLESYDLIEATEDSILQHGSVNDRVYIMKILKNPRDVIEKAKKLAFDNKYSKIFAKADNQSLAEFLLQDFVIEAVVPGGISGKRDLFFVSKYMTSERKSMFSERNYGDLQRITTLLGENSQGDLSKSEFDVRILDKTDIELMIPLFREVFETYPFPIFDPKFLAESMDEGTIYFGAFYNNQLAGISSAETVVEYRIAEMTDFAVSPKFRKKGIASILLREMENYLCTKDFLNLYTICRSVSPGINKLFLNANYKYSGTLFNNTQISGSLESMNVLYKSLK